MQKIRDYFTDKPHLSTAICVTILILVAIVSHLQWFNPFSILQFGDWQYRPDEHVRQLITSWTTWVPFNNLGEVNILLSGYPFRGIAWSTITLLGFSYDIATKLTLFVPIAIGGFLAPFFLSMHLFKDRYVAMIVALSYGASTYFLVTQTTHLPITLIYAFLPLLVLCLDYALDTNRLRYWILLVLGFSVGIFYEIRMMYVVALILLAYFISFTLLKRVHIKYYVKPILISVAVLVTVNLFWIVPTILGAGNSISAVAERGLFGNQLFDLEHSFTMMKWNWTGSLVDRSFTLQPTALYLWIVPFIAFLGMAFRTPYRRRMLVFAVITVMGILISKQSAEPFTSLYEWLYTYIPGFSIFREASKLYLLIAFGYIGLIGYTLLTLKLVYAKYSQKSKKYAYTIAGSLLLVVACINLWPGVTTEIGGTFKSSAMPSDYVALNSFIKKQPDYFRTYWVPRDSWWGYYDNTHPKVKSSDMLAGEWAKYLKRPGGNRYDVAGNNIEIFNQSFSKRLFDNASIKYVIVPSQGNENEDNFFSAYGNDRDYFIDNLDNVDFLKRIDIGANRLAVYENENYGKYTQVSSSQFNAIDSDNINDLSNIATRFFDVPLGTIKSSSSSAVNLLTPGFSTETQNAGSTISKDIESPGKKVEVIDKGGSSIFYQVKDGQLIFSMKSTGELTADDRVLERGGGNIVINEFGINRSDEYFFDIGNKIQPVDLSGKTRYLGVIDSPINIKTVAGNATFDGSDMVSHDCKNRLNDINTPIRDSRNAQIQIDTRLSIKCRSLESNNIRAGGSYVLMMDYRSDNSQRGGFKIKFDKGGTVVRNDFFIPDAQSRTYMQKVEVPDGASKLEYQLYGYPEQNFNGNAKNYYTDFELKELVDFAEIRDIQAEKKYELGGAKKLTYIDTTYTFKNLIQNPSFEDESWEEEVDDCHNYDSHPNIAMNTPIVNDRGKVLELSASNHTACTRTDPIDVSENSAYSFKFSYSAQNIQQVRYNLRYNDPAQTSIDRYVKVEKKGWNAHSTIEHSPRGATKATLTVYATPNTYGTKRVVISYDDFSLVNVPDIFDKYYLAARNIDNLKTPSRVNTEMSRPTEKRIKVEGAKSPFYLTVNEAYDKNWQLGSYRPIHYSALGGVNGWYIDPSLACKDKMIVCEERDDGYALTIPIRYDLQKWFNVGIWISGSVFLASVLYVVYPLLKRRRDSNVK